MIRVQRSDRCSHLGGTQLDIRSAHESGPVHNYNASMPSCSRPDILESQFSALASAKAAGGSCKCAASLAGGTSSPAEYTYLVSITCPLKLISRVW